MISTHTVPPLLVTLATLCRSSASRADLSNSTTVLPPPGNLSWIRHVPEEALIDDMTVGTMEGTLRSRWEAMEIGRVD